MSMGDPSEKGDPSENLPRPRWRDDPSVGRESRPSVSPAPEPPPDSVAVAAAGGDLDIARDSDVPISTQLYWQLAYQIDTGRLHPGSRLPTVRELGAILYVNPNTVRAVYRRLAEAGYVVSRQGAGTRVTARAPQRRTSGALEGLVAELLRSAARSGYSRRRGRLGRLRGRGRAEAPRAARPGPVRGMHDLRRAAGRRADRRLVRRPRRRGRRPDRPDGRPPGSLPLRPGGHVHVPR